jgi:HEAT repeat protein
MRRAFPAVCVLIALGVLVSSSAGAQEDETQARIKRLHDEMIDLFELGRLEEAREKARQILELDPKAEEAFRLVQEAGERIYRQMMVEPPMGREPRVIYELYQLHVSRLKRKPDHIKSLVQVTIDPTKHPVRRWQAIHKLLEVGQFAIPFLVDALGDELNHEIRALARVTATKMGRQAVLPVIELLKMKAGDDATEEERNRARFIRENAALILGDIEPTDERALAGLKRVAEDPEDSPVVRKYAQRSLQKITGIEAERLPSAQDYYYRKADRYVRERAGVATEAKEMDGVIWRLEDGKLVDYQLPRYAWNELMAEQACYECMDIDPTYDAIYPVYGEVMASQIAEVRELIDIALERPWGRPFSEEELAEVQARDTKLLVEELKLDMHPPALVSTPKLEVPRTTIWRSVLLGGLGPVNVYRGLGKCLEDAEQDERSLPKLAAGVLSDMCFALDPDGRLLPGMGQSVAPRERRGRRGREVEAEPVAVAGEGAPLIRALRFPDERVQYAAAIAIARMNPPAAFEGAGEVVQVLARAVAESGPVQVLLVEEDPSIRNEMVSKLRELDVGVTVAESARDGLARATGFPPFDVVIVSPKLTGAAEGVSEDTDWLLNQIVAEERARSVAIAILTSVEKRDEDVRTFKDRANVMGFIPIEFSGKDLRDLVWKIASQRVFPIMSKKQSLEISIAAAEALAGIDPHLALMNGMQVNQCAQACIEALTNRPDRLRRPCIEALGNFGIAAAHERLTEIARDRAQALEIRAAAIRSLGQITPELAFDLILELSRDEQEYVLRYLAGQSYGRGKPPFEQLRTFLKENRLPLGTKRALLPIGD